MSARRVAGLLLLVLGVMSNAAAAPAPRVLGPAERVDGKRVDAYPALWWQWVNRKRWGATAFQDPTGAQCALNQSGPVWFLAGTDGTDEFHRRCRVPSGKHVFLPVVTMIENAPAGDTRTCAQLKAEAADNNDHLVVTEVSVDGVAIDVRPLRMASGECFNGNAFSDYLKDGGAGYRSATDGYWLMLAPFADGQHSLRVNVRYDNPGAEVGDMEQVFDYELEVGGEEPSPPPPEPDEDDGPEWRQA